MSKYDSLLSWDYNGGMDAYRIFLEGEEILCMKDDKEFRLTLANLRIYEATLNRRWENERLARIGEKEKL